MSLHWERHDMSGTSEKWTLHENGAQVATILARYFGAGSAPRWELRDVEPPISPEAAEELDRVTLRLDTYGTDARPTFQPQGETA